jgi:hypothetical protein
VLTELLGDFKVILQLVGVLSYGKLAKRITDMAIDLMQGIVSRYVLFSCDQLTCVDVQNLRKTIYE